MTEDTLFMVNWNQRKKESGEIKDPVHQPSSTRS